MSGYYPPPSGAPPHGAPPAHGYSTGGGYGTGGGYSTGGGFHRPEPSPQEMMWKWFTSVDVDGNGRITAMELQQALKNGNHTTFDISTIEMLIRLFDSDRSGTITFHEFQGIFKYVQDWAGIFVHVDRNKSGSIDSHELQDGLKQFGYNLSPQLVERLVQRYAPGGHVSLDRFMRVCVVVKSLHEYVQPRIDSSGWIHLNYEQTLEFVLNAPRY